MIFPNMNFINIFKFISKIAVKIYIVHGNIFEFPLLSILIKIRSW